MSENEETTAAPYKELVLKELPKPKHPEMYSTEEKASFQPWRVILRIELSFDDYEPVDYEIFLRAATPDHAQYLAAGMFNILEHYHKGRGENDYPIISDNTPSLAYKISEQDYYKFWKEAQRDVPGRHFVKTGMKENPTMFRFWEDGWDELHSDGIRHGSPHILVPDLAAVKAATESKL